MKYKNANTVAECLAYLKEAKGAGRIIAGGTDLILALRTERIQAETLVDISNINELKSIKVQEGFLVIGAAVTLNEIIKSPQVKKHAPILALAANCIASMQIRNLATVVGNVVNACPEADCAVSLMALDAVFTVNDGKTTREVPILAMYDAVKKSTIDSTRELVTEVRIPCADKNETAVYKRFALRKAMAPAILNTAVVIRINNNKITHARIAMGPVQPVVTRTFKAEEFLTNREVTLDNFKQAARLTNADASPEDNPFRGNAEYLRQVLVVLVERALTEAADGLGYKMQLAS